LSEAGEVFVEGWLTAAEPSAVVVGFWARPLIDNATMTLRELIASVPRAGSHGRPNRLIRAILL
jgi:hypothetical protein